MTRIAFIRAGWGRSASLVGCLLAISALSATAAPVQRDLGDGLTYFRIHALPADLPADAALPHHSSVLDLRYVHADPATASVVAGWLKFHASPKLPVFVLINRETAPALLTLLRRDAAAGVITIGMITGRHEADLSISQSAEEERRAYDALESGESVAQLTTDHPDKQRNDEASLSTHDHAGDVAGEVSDDGVDRLPAAAKPPPRPTDAALQRAIQVYRGLRALKKL